MVIAATLAGSTLTVATAHADDGVTEVCRFGDSRFDEISGLTYSQRHPGILYLHNDSSGGPFVYAVDAQTCRTVATLTLSGAQARDFEAIASGRDRKGRPVIWVGDIGDNLNSRSSVELLRFREPKVLRDRAVRVRTYRVGFPDGPVNSEALLADPSSLRVWIVTKRAAGGAVYELPRRLSPSQVNEGERVGAVGGLVTDGAVSPDGSRFAVRDYVDAQVRTGLPPGGDPQTVFLPLQVQGEAMTWTQDGNALLIAGERDARLLRVLLNSSVPAPADSSQAAAPEASRTVSPTASGMPSSAASTTAPSAQGSPDSAPTSGDSRPAAVIAVLLIVVAVGVIATAEWRRRRRPA